MHLKSLRVFCDVVRLKSFSRAAEENGVSQSAASQMVHHLEERLQAKLIDRSKRPFLLTAEGKVYYDGCRSIVERYEVLEERVRNLHREVAGRVRVASIYSIGLHHMNSNIQEFLAQYPKANVRLEYLHPHRVYQSVEREAVDLGLVSYPKSSRTIQAMPWRREPMVFVCAPQHSLAGEKSIDLSKLAGLPMVYFDRDLTIRREIDRVLHARNIEVEVAIEFDNIETIKRAIEVNLGAGLLPEPTVRREVQAGTLVAIPLETAELIRPIGIIKRRGRELSPAALRFIEQLQRQDRQPPDVLTSVASPEISASAASAASPSTAASLSPAAESPAPGSPAPESPALAESAAFEADAELGLDAAIAVGEAKRSRAADEAADEEAPRFDATVGSPAGVDAERGAKSKAERTPRRAKAALG